MQNVQGSSTGSNASAQPPQQRNRVPRQAPLFTAPSMSACSMLIPSSQSSVMYPRHSSARSSSPSSSSMAIHPSHALLSTRRAMSLQQARAGARRTVRPVPSSSTFGLLPSTRRGMANRRRVFARPSSRSDASGSSYGDPRNQ